MFQNQHRVKCEDKQNASDVVFCLTENRKTHPLSILARFLLGPSRSGGPKVLVPAIFPAYVDPGSVAGRYEKTGFFGSRLTPDCCKDKSEGGPGRISVARAASPSKWGGCTTGTPGNVYAGALAMELMVSSGQGRQTINAATVVVASKETRLMSNSISQ
jgi:hypothetical protein